jgi:transcriptional regulator with XRE-family HTH domain
MGEQSAWLIDIDGRKYDLRLKVDRDRFTETETAISISTQLRALRIMRGWTQRELARRAGMHQERISLLENPATLAWSMDTLARIADAFDVALVARFDPWSAVLGRVAGEPVVPEYAHDEKLRRA